nr:hypothetical protein [Tanacetum cinerariifolium]
MKESKAYKTYLGYATGTIPPKVSRKFKKASPSKKDSVTVPADKKPILKGKRVKRSTKKSSTTPTIGIIIIREPPVETQSKRKEKVDVARGKGIDLLSEVPLTEEAQMKEVRKKSLRYFHKSHPSGSGVPDVTKDDSTESKSESWGNNDDSNNEKGSKHENDSEEHESDSEQDTDGSESDSKYEQQDDDDEVKDDDEDDDNDDDQSEGDEDRGMDSDDVQDKKAYIRTTDAQQEKENLEITQE